LILFQTLTHKDELQEENYLLY